MLYEMYCIKKLCLIVIAHFIFSVIMFWIPSNIIWDSLNKIEANKNAKRNTFIITGLATDFTFLNLNSDDFSFKMSNQKEDYLASYNSGFNLFSTLNIGFEQFPPLENKFNCSIFFCF